MKERLIAKLYAFQKKLSYIDFYNQESGRILFKYSIEFESLLNLLLKINLHDFNAIALNYAQETQRYCQLGCELNEEASREKAFSAG
jgi:hypothetical protein